MAGNSAEKSRFVADADDVTIRPATAAEKKAAQDAVRDTNAKFRMRQKKAERAARVRK